MGGMTAWFDRRFYADYAKNWDDELLRRRIAAKLTPQSVALDLGAGAGIVTQMNFRDMAARVCGVDLDPRVVENPFLHEGKVGTVEAIPYPDATFDLVFADNVLEHLSQPQKVFDEVARVLRPGGIFLFKTPNKWHYMPLISRMMPYSFHRYYNRKRGRSEVDTFPTCYRANSRGQVAKLAAAAGLTIEVLELIEGRPEYLRISPLSYVGGLVYERLVNSTELLAPLRVVLIGTLRKPA